MSTPNDGGPAFPSPTDRFPDGCVNAWMEYGMSLRDWFAGEAIKGICDVCQFDTPEPMESREQMLARKCYSFADAMLAARERKEDA